MRYSLCLIKLYKKGREAETPPHFCPFRGRSEAGLSAKVKGVFLEKEAAETKRKAPHKYAALFGDPNVSKYEPGGASEGVAACAAS